MFIRTAGKTLTRTCASVDGLQRNSQTQPLLLVSKRFKTENVCEKPKKPRKLLKITGLALVGTVAAVVAAKHDDDFREWTRKNVATLDSMVKIIYKEEETYGEFLDRYYKELAQGFKNGLYNMVQGVKESTTKIRDREEELPKESKLPGTYKSSDSAFVIRDKQDDKESKGRVPANMKHLKLLEDRLFKDTQEAMSAYNLAVEANKEKRNFIDYLDQLISRRDSKLWEKLKTKTEDEKRFSERFGEAVEKVKKSAENLRLQMSKTAGLASDVRKSAERNISHSLSSVNKAKENLSKDQNSQNLAVRSWEKARMARIYFSDQLETMFPNVWLNDEKLNLPMDKLTPFIENVMDNILYAEKNLYKLETILEPQVKNSAEVVQSGGSSDLVQVFVDIESEREKRVRREEIKKAVLTNEAKCEKTNKESLKNLTEVYNDLKTEALAIREREVDRRMYLLLDEQLGQLRTDHQLEVAKMVGRIQGANEAVASRGDKEKTLQVKQQFWSAAQSLLSAVKPIESSEKSNEPRPLKNEIKNLQKAAPEGDELVKTVLGTIPTEVVEQGVPSEECLKQRFLVVEKEARHLAGLPSGPVSLLQHAVVRLQSALYIDLPIPQAELNNEPTDLDALNNYQVLQRARYYVDHGELDQAVRYLNLLEGPSSKVASNWIKDVIAHLEAVQAAELLLAHASAFNQN